MYRLFATLSLTLLMLFTSGAAAQQPLNEAERDRVFSEIRAYKHKLIAKELDLDNEQEKLFFPVYDKMDDQLQQIGAETRDLERNVLENVEASDTEVEAAAPQYTRKNSARERSRLNTMSSSKKSSRPDSC